jgi:Ca2+-binding RTX toxin-like protein
VLVVGGRGDDVLRGSRGADMLDGRWGNDILRGDGGNDTLNGSFGSDVVAGGRGDDDLVDGETDATAARDVYRGGPSGDSAGSDRGDRISYGLRLRDLNINLSRNRVMKSAERDDIAGLESVAGGAGDDRIVGDGDDNWLEGNGGGDVIRARNGDDIPMGGKGDDRVAGDVGEDVVWGDDGIDSLTGGPGDDLMDGDDEDADRVSCGSGDDIARVTRRDTLGHCETATKGNLYVRVEPRIDGNEAIFRVACQQLGGCSGTLTVAGRNSEDYGSGSFTNLPDDPQTFSDVSVTLTPEAVADLENGALISVGYGNDEGGYRAFVRP